MRVKPLAVIAATLLPIAATRAAEAPAADAPLLIGMPSVFTGAHFHAQLFRAAKAEAEAHGAKLIVTDALGDADKQSKDVGELVAKGVKGIVIAPMPGVTAAVEAAAKAGVAIATVDTTLVTDTVLFHAGGDNLEGGRMAARFIVERLKGKGSVLELEGLPGWTAADQRKAGFEEVIVKSGVKLLASQPADWDRARGQQVMSAMMKAHPGFDAVFSANDDMILGAIDAMIAAGVDPSAKVTVGVDGTPLARENIKAGKLTATVDHVPAKQARLAVDRLLRYLKDGTRPPQQSMLVPPELVTREQP